MWCQANDERRAQYTRALFDAIPLPALVVDEDVAIQDFNAAAEDFLGRDPALALHQRCGEALHCLNSEAKGCGQSERCQECVIRQGVRQAVEGKDRQRWPHRATLRIGKCLVPINLRVTTSLLPYTEKPRVLVILDDAERISRARSRVLVEGGSQ